APTKRFPIQIHEIWTGFATKLTKSQKLLTFLLTKEVPALLAYSQVPPACDSGWLCQLGVDEVGDHTRPLSRSLLSAAAAGVLSASGAFAAVPAPNTVRSIADAILAEAGC